MSESLDNLDTQLLRGVVGSHAYGLAGADSDIDRLGVYAAPTRFFHGLYPPMGKLGTLVSTDPDITMHEAARFASLALKGNPTVMELLWLPDELYEVRTDLGDRLISLRESFLSAARVRDAYLGYAVQQFSKLTGGGRFPNVPVARVAKHARHLWRLLEQGTGLWTTGQLSVRVADPAQVLTFGERVAAGETGLAESAIGRARSLFNQVSTTLPPFPDEQVVESWLLDVRSSFLR